MAKEPRKLYTFRFSEGVMVKMAEIAKSENRATSNLIETILIKYIDAKNHKKTEPG